MKTRNGFVSNSSSTSFTFVFKGKTFEDFEKLMFKHKELFNISLDGAWWNETDEYNAPSSFDYHDITNAIKARPKIDPALIELELPPIPLLIFLDSQRFQMSPSLT